MRLAATTSLSVLAALLASPGLAQTRTSTAGDVTNPSGATLTPAAGGAAIIVDSDNAATNAGTISQTDVDNVIGITTTGNRTGTITNSGTIGLTETYAASDTNGDGIVDPPFAGGTGRIGIRLGSDGTFTGTVANSGTITIKGNASAGIYADAPIVGNVSHTGTITVTGDNGYGIRLAQVTGNVIISGATTVTGANSVGIALDGPVTGQITLHGTTIASGYSVTTLPTTLTSLTAANTLQGGPAVRIGGSVTGGVFIAGTATTTDSTDADGDGIADSSQSAGIITSYGSAPALQVGSAGGPITIGTFSGQTGGLVNAGTIKGSGIYAGFSATGLQIGGLGGAVTINGGILNSGLITASANTAQATAIHLSGGAATPGLTNSGTIAAYGNVASGASARAIAIDAGASLPAITNSGTIAATVAFTGGRATAILDGSGTLATVTNTGTIAAADADGLARAIDVSASTGGFSYTQSQSATTTAVPAISGAIVTGSGPATLTVSAGTVKSTIIAGGGGTTFALSGTAAYTGTTTLTGGGNQVSLAGSATYTGALDFGSGGGALAITGGAFSGTLANAGAAAVAVTGGSLALSGTGTTTIGSLALSGGTLGITVDTVAGAASRLAVTGATTIGSGSILQANLSKLGIGTQSYTILTSGTLTGSANLSLSTPALPYLMTGALTGNDAAGTVTLTIGRKSAAALGFNRSETAAYDAVYAAITGNAQLNTLFTGLTDAAGTLTRYRQMLPDHDGGLFDIVSKGVRTLAPGTGATPLADVGSFSVWVNQAYWGARQHSADTGGWNGNGWGLTAGADTPLGGFGRVGASIGYLYGQVKEGSRDEATANQFQGGLHWIASHAGFNLTAYGVAGYDHMTSARSIDSVSTASPLLLTSKGRWNGLFYGGGGKLSYELKLGTFYIKPVGDLSYARLHEGAHDDSGGGIGFDLSVNARTSDEFAATGRIALGAQLAGDGSDPEATVWRVELEGGRRQVIGGKVGATTAHFGGGQDFTLLPDQRDSGYTGSASVSAGNENFRIVASGLADTRTGYRSIGGSIGLRGYF